jgi:hypothetical protein
MAISSLFRNVIEIGFGVLYVIGAIFNFLYTLRHGDEFYGSLADKALFVWSSQLIRDVVIPHARSFTILFIASQLVVALCILSRGTIVRPGLIAGATLSLAVVFVSNIPGAIANLIMSIFQVYLALIR